MERASSDRGVIMHFAGFHHLSPALEAGRPAFSRSAADGLARCGWGAFFRALSEGGLALSAEPSDPDSARFVAASGAGGAAPAHRARGALAHARRFLAALFGP